MSSGGGLLCLVFGALGAAILIDYFENERKKWKAYYESRSNPEPRHSPSVPWPVPPPGR